MWPRGVFLLKLKPYNGDLWAEPELFIRAAHPGIQHRHSTLKGSWPWGMAIIFLGIVFAYLGRVVIFLQPQGRVGMEARGTFLVWSPLPFPALSLVH